MRVSLEKLAKERGGVLAQLAVVGTKGGEEVGIDVEFANDLASDENGYDNFGFGFDGTGQVARIGIDIVDHNGLAAGGGCAADALIQRNARVRRHGALERAQGKHVAAF